MPRCKSALLVTKQPLSSIQIRSPISSSSWRYERCVSFIRTGQCDSDFRTLQASNCSPHSSSTKLVFIGNQVTQAVRRTLLEVATRMPSESKVLSHPSADNSFPNQSVKPKAPSREGAFLCSWHSRFCMATFQAPSHQHLCLTGRNSYDGYRLRAEVLLFGTAFTVCSPLSLSQVVPRLCVAMVSPRLRASEQFCCLSGASSRTSTRAEAWQQVLPVADLPDSLLFWVFYRHLPALVAANLLRAFACFNDLPMLLHQSWPGRQTFLPGVDSRGYRQPVPISSKPVA